MDRVGEGGGEGKKRKKPRKRHKRSVRDKADLNGGRKQCRQDLENRKEAGRET